MKKPHDAQGDSPPSGGEQQIVNGGSDAFRRAVEQRDHAALLQSLAPNVVFHSPIVHHAYVGREAVASLLAAVLETISDFVYRDEFTASDGKVLLYSTHIGERDMEGVHILKFDSDGLVQEITVMVRPYSAATAFREAMAAKLTTLQAEKFAQ